MTEPIDNEPLPIIDDEVADKVADKVSDEVADKIDEVADKIDEVADKIDDEVDDEGVAEHLHPFHPHPMPWFGDVEEE